MPSPRPKVGSKRRTKRQLLFSYWMYMLCGSLLLPFFFIRHVRRDDETSRRDLVSPAHIPSRPAFSDRRGRSGSLDRKCRCGTDKEILWFACKDKEKRRSHEDFFMRFCEDEKGGKDFELDITLPRRDYIVRNSKAKDKGPLPPNILFLEINSVSLAAVKRDLPLTYAIMKKYEMSSLPVGEESTGADASSSSCYEGMCAVSYSNALAVGESTMPSQVAALVGCSTGNPWVGLPRKMEKTKPAIVHAFCPPALEGQKETQYWTLFDHAKKRGYVTFMGDEFCTKKYPHLRVDYFKIQRDISLDPLMCALAEHYRLQHRLPYLQTPLWSIAEGNATRPAPYLGNRPRRALSLEYIEQIWETYPDRPKFAYLDSGTRRDPSVDPSFRTLEAAAYDEHLSAFLARMLRRIKRRGPEHPRTVIVVRSGDWVYDRAYEVERPAPWNVLAVPEELLREEGAEGGEIFRYNRDKNVTGYDLHLTLQRIIGGGHARAKGRGPYDLLTQKVPRGRTCHDARVPTYLCPRKETASGIRLGDSLKKEEE